TADRPDEDSPSFEGPDLSHGPDVFQWAKRDPKIVKRDQAIAQSLQTEMRQGRIERVRDALKFLSSRNPQLSPNEVIEFLYRFNGGQWEFTANKDDPWAAVDEFIVPLEERM